MVATTFLPRNEVAASACKGWSMSQITHLLVNRIAETLEYYLMTNVPVDDPTRVNLVKTYRFQQDPRDPGTYLFVAGGNPSKIDLKDARVSAKDMEDLGMKIPTGEIGGGHYWWRRGIVGYGMYYISQRYEQTVAADYAHQTLGKIQAVMDSCVVADLLDDFGEQAFMLIQYANTLFEGGGPADQYIWRGELYWQALTRRIR